MWVDELPAKIGDHLMPLVESGCWIWERGIGSSGYANVWLDSRTQLRKKA